MACCSRDGQNDLEVESTLGKNCETCDVLPEKPLSPIIASAINRKFLLGRRLKQHKSRTKLSDRFSDSPKQEINLVDENVLKWLDESFTASQNVCLIDRLDKLEELENSRRNVYKLMVNGTKQNDLCFKKPKSPAPTRIKKTRNHTEECSSNLSEDVYTGLYKNLPSIPVAQCSGFQTATGKVIPVSETDIKQHSKLFADIMNSSDNSVRRNKYSYLKKTKTDKFVEQNLSENVNRYKLGNVPRNKQTVNVDVSLAGFRNAPRTSIQVSKQTLSNVTKIFNEELGDLDPKIIEQCGGFTKASSNFKKTEKMVSNLGKSDYSLSQAIRRSGVSDTQMLYAVDDLNAKSSEYRNTDGFRGFDEKELRESQSYYQRGIALCSRAFNKKRSEISVFSIAVQQTESTEFEISREVRSNKRTVDEDVPLPLTKRFCFDKSNHAIEGVNCIPTFQDKENEFFNASKKTLHNSLMNEARFNVPSKVVENQNRPSLGQSNAANFSLPKNCLGGFSSASGKSITISEKSLKKTSGLFDDMDFNFPISKENLFVAPNSRVDNCKPNINNDFLKRTSFPEFSKDVSQNNAVINCTNKNVINAQVLNSPLTSQQSVDKRPLDFGGRAMKKTKEVLRETYSSGNTPRQENLVETTPTRLYRPSKCSGNLSTNSKRRLGVSACKQIQISSAKLSKAKLLFEEDISEKSPQRPNTYLGKTSCSTPIRSNGLVPLETFSSFVGNINITPIKNNIRKGNALTIVPNSGITLMSPTNENVDERINELEQRLKLLRERLEALTNTKNSKLGVDERPRKGVLYQSKSTNQRVSLISLLNDEQPNACPSTFYVSPKHAESVHFKTYSAVVLSKDGATVVPNTQDVVGISEIENGFHAMPGVESRLIPKGWIRNHYKWIVWKLVSYENMFPKNLSGCLNVENVVQQLKYRYDREIDRAERSALRKVYEKDDVPQKRMVLCVSDIKLIDGKKHEIDLSDGWYSIRTTVDEPLCIQIFKGRIQIGTKLVVSGAELLNCDGCHPLEATNLISLRIHFNSTRRALWHARLGYQPCPGPFPIQLKTVHPSGGPIGAVRVCIMRVYPFKYMEKANGRSLWMNKKAETVRARHWENDRYKRIEQIQEELQQKLESCSRNESTSLEKRSSTDVSGISCPRTLYEIMQNSNDPDLIQENLSHSQKTAVLDYQRNILLEKQQEMSVTMKKDVENLKANKRDVVPVLKLLLMDADEHSGSDKTYNFFIWKPTEFHTQILKEGTSVTIHNVLPKKNGDLSASTKTTFKTESVSHSLYDKFRRSVVEIEAFFGTNFAPNFNEFDTVGLVVQTKTDVDKQEVWITDSMGRLLLANVYEGPSTCLLLDSLKRGEAVTICNLIYRSVRNDIVQALANHFTVFSYYSQYRHLQEGLDSFKNKLPKDVDNLLNACDSKIEVFKIKNSNIKNSFHTNFEDSDEETLVYSRITNSDIALSLIDLDKFT